MKRRLRIQKILRDILKSNLNIKFIAKKIICNFLCVSGQRIICCTTKQTPILNYFHFVCCFEISKGVLNHSFSHWFMWENHIAIGSITVIDKNKTIICWAAVWGRNATLTHNQDSRDDNDWAQHTQNDTQHKRYDYNLSVCENTA